MADAPLSSTVSTRNIEEIWQEYHLSRRDDLLELLTVHYLPHVRKVADRIAARLPHCVEIDDLLQEGAIGLRRAIQAFDPQRRVRFTTFLVFHVRGAILDALRAMNWTPRLVLQRARAVEQATARFERIHGRKPAESEVLAELQRTEKNARLTFNDSRRVMLLPFAGSRNRDDRNVAPEYTLAADTPDPVAQAQASELRQLLMHGLTRAEKLIVMLYYYENMTMKEIGRVLNFSESRVSQKHSSVVLRLKARLRETELAFAK